MDILVHMYVIYCGCTDFYTYIAFEDNFNFFLSKLHMYKCTCTCIYKQVDSPTTYMCNGYAVYTILTFSLLQWVCSSNIPY